MSKDRKAPLVWIFGACLTAITIQASYFSVRPGYRGVVLDKMTGKLEEEILPEGPHFLIPFLKKPTKFPVKTQKISSHLFLTSEKNQYLKYTIKYEPILEDVLEIFEQWGPAYNITMESVAKVIVKDALVDGSLTISNNMESQFENLIKSKFKEYHFNAHDIHLEEVKL